MKTFELLLRRHWLTNRSSVGELFILKDFCPGPGSTIGLQRECYTLEDQTRGAGEEKVPGETAIPTGRYRVTIDRSPSFSERAGHDVFTPRLHDVPGFVGILIHPGNHPVDTRGCILVGRKLGAGPDEILESQLAYDDLYLKIRSAIDRGEEVWISVEVDAARLVA